MFGSRESMRSSELFVVLCVLFAGVQVAEESVIGENRTERDDRGQVKLLKWTHSVWLGEALTSPRLYWNPKKSYVEFKIEANTIGGIVLSFNDDDLILLWVDDVTGKAHIEDYHFGNDSRSAVRDVEESYHLVGGEQNTTHTQIAFRRPWNTCDRNDALLGSDTLFVNWSIHPHDEMLPNLFREDPDELSGVFYGEKSLLLKVPTQPQIPRGPHIHQWDVLMRNVVIDEKTTNKYWCKVFRTPPLPPRKSHIVAYEPMILSNFSNLIHHMILYECDAPPGFLDSYASSKHNGAHCYSSEMPNDWYTCVAPVAIWVVGGEQKVLPDHIGLPIGPRQTYFMLEIHYNNPDRRRAIDNSGFRLYHTEELRTFDAGVMYTGVTVTPLYLLPPDQEKYRSVGLCNDVCTSKVFPPMGIKIVSVLLHSHQSSRAMRLRHIRGNTELPHIVENNKFDVNYQVDRTLEQEVVVFPTDHLITECNYNTIDKKNPSMGTNSPREEICSSFALYYPRTDLASCHSMSPVRYFFKALGIKSFYNFTMDDIEKYVLKSGPLSSLGSPISPLSPFPVPNSVDLNSRIVNTGDDNVLLKLVISEPYEFKDRNLSSHLASLPWSDTLFTESFESSLAQGFKIVFCRLRNNQLAIVPNIESFPKFDELPPEVAEDCIQPNYLEANSASAGLSLLLIPIHLIYTVYLCVY
ncbi:UNVERIFIED_CONTAM: hypothetical protein PYX00_002987 [Menopon gallinae]|uniref:DOMON domain-containing protein n=1 Tax=Menopon gallinae TaxID=328185 RepID=A0AAW2HZ34_9NEOP